MTDLYDIAFVGHMCYDEISTPDMPEPVVSPGSAVLCGAMAAARTGKRIAAVVRMAPEGLRDEVWGRRSRLRIWGCDFARACPKRG